LLPQALVDEFRLCVKVPDLIRAQFEGGTPIGPAKYIDLSYYQKALAGT